MYYTLDCEDDLHAMYRSYASYPRKEIMLWCDSRDCDEDLPKTKGRKTSDTMTKREETEQRVVETAEELREMHENSLELSEVQYRLWARMLVTRVHSSKENPPQVPMMIPMRKYSMSSGVSKGLGGEY
jgi:hypothetical protein